MKMQRNEGAHADFTKWNFENGIEELNPFLNKMLNNALSVVFSEDGADAELFLDKVTEDDLLIDCVIFIDDLGVFAEAKFSLREIISELLDWDRDEGDMKKIATTLRSLADTISTNA